MKKNLNLILLLLWMIIIFILSHQTADMSTDQSNIIVNMLDNIINIKNIELLSLVIRKLAHLIEYLILGILMINCLKDYKFRKYLLISIFLCFVYACSDEFHQLFISGRSGQLFDVFIDTIGSIIGNLIFIKLNKYK